MKHLDGSPKTALGTSPPEVLDVEGWAREAMPEMRPNWDFNTREGQETVSRYHDALLHGFQVGAKKPTNMSKITTIQKADKTPTSSYERRVKCSGYTPRSTLKNPKING